jgi:septum site-determining protein MinC
MEKSANPVQIKGQKDGLWILLDDSAPVDETFDVLDQKLASSNNFFAGAEVTVNAGTRTFSDDERTRLSDMLETQYGLRIKEIEESVPRPARIPAPHELVEQQPDEEEEMESPSQGALQDMDDDIMKALDETFWIPVRQPQVRHEPESDDHYYEGEGSTLYFRGTVRSGQSLEFPGNIVILGDVNPGAYVIASGDIIVIGRLNGVVHAGAEGEERAVIIGAEFSPSQLRIAHYIGRPPDEKPHGKTERRSQTEKASIKDEGIVIEPII